jgi:serine phosphatase RsbU (regulator of sigma subunit)
MRTLEIRFRFLLFLFLLVTLFLVVEAATTLYFNYDVKTKTLGMMDVYLPANTAVGNLQSHVLGYHAANLEGIFAQSSEEMAQKEDEAEAYLIGEQADMQNLKKLASEAGLSEPLLSFEENLKKYQGVVKQVKSLLKSDKVMEAFKIYDQQLLSSYQNLIFDLGKIRTRLAELSDEAARTTARTLDQTQIFVLVTSSAAVVLALLSLGGVGVGRDINQIVRKIQENEAALAEKNQEITASIQYAQRIQKTVLRPLHSAIKTESDPWVLNLPRDIVSGDFFWSGENHGCTMMAVVDCTGHGVPGAFMSLLGYLTLEEVFIVNSRPDPGEMLNLFHSRISAILQQEAPDSIQDGMDVVLCIYEPQREVLRFAGARRPLYYWTESEGMQEIKGDRESVGGEVQRLRKFMTHEVKVEPGMAFYLASDGLVDQPGADQRRLTSAGLKKMLSEVAPLTWTQQRDKFAQALISFCGSTAQRDDLCLVAWQPVAPIKKMA